MMNIVLVDAHLNKNVIRAKPPSVYIKEFERENPALESTLSTHFIGNPDTWGIHGDGYEIFIRKRSKRIARRLNEILNPFSDKVRPRRRYG